MSIKSRIKEANITFQWEGDDSVTHNVEISNKETVEITVDGQTMPYEFYRDILEFVHNKWPSLLVK